MMVYSHSNRMKHSFAQFKGKIGLLSFCTKRCVRILLVCFILLSQHVSAQENPWIIGLYTHSNHFITNNVLALASLGINMPVASLTEGAATMDFNLYNFHYMDVTDNGEGVDFDRVNPYGFTAYDLFNEIECGLKFGWQGAESPIGLYFYGAYGLNQYKFRFLGEQNYSKHRLQSVRLGVRTRLSPLVYLLEDYEWCPILEVGTTYVHNFKYKGPNNSDMDQINNGMRTYYAVGAQFSDHWSAMLCLEMANYDLFNRNYTPDGGFWYPYANFKNKDIQISVRFNVSLWED